MRPIKRVKPIYSIPFLILLLVLTFYLSKGALRVFEKKLESSAELNELNNRAASLEFREGVLEQDIERLSTKEGIEEEIRERFVVSQEKEHVVIIVEDETAASSTDLSKQPWYKRFWNAIIPGL